MQKRKTSKVVQTILVGLIIIAALSLSSVFASALITKNYCLTDGQTIEFSKCNSGMSDFTCTSTSCQICASKSSTGVYCQANPTKSECGAPCIPFEENTETLLPAVTLTSPSNFFVKTGAGNVDFGFDLANVKNTNVKNCTLILDNVFVMTKTSLTISNTLTYNVNVGEHQAHIECITKDTATPSNYKFSSEEKTFTIDPIQNQTNNQTNDTQPTQTTYNITLSTPTDNYAVTGAQAISFNYDFVPGINIIDIFQCNLLLNDQIVNSTMQETKMEQINTTNARGQNKTVTNITTVPVSKEMSYTVPLGSYSWKVQCINLKGKNLSSATRTLSVNSPPAPSGSSSSSGGGGGGGGSSGGGIVRNTPKNNTNSTLQNVTMLSQNVTDTEEENLSESESETTEEAPITGGVIGNALGKNKYTIIIVIIVVLGVLFFYTKNKSKTATVDGVVMP